MPYRNIAFVKLEKRLLNDPRWWTMSDYSQLIYIKLMLVAAETYNKIPKKEAVLMASIRTSLSVKDFRICMSEIRKNFPKLKKEKDFYYFEEFNTKTNWVDIKELPGNSRVFPKVDGEGDQEGDQEGEEEGTPLTPHGLFSKEEEKQIRKRIANTQHHSVNSEANIIAFEKLIQNIAKDKKVKNPVAVAMWRAAQK